MVISVIGALVTMSFRAVAADEVARKDQLTLVFMTKRQARPPA
jgi:hypothetical protein